MSTLYRAPWDSALLKNRAKMIHGRGKKKWIGLTEDYRKAKLELTHVLRSLKDEKWKDKAKVYVDIVVFKPNHKSDAINMIDGVCDAIKEVIPVDDRYYGVWCDWEIDKENPRLEIRVWQFEG